MANRIKRKQPINRDWFRWVCSQRGVSMNGLAKKTEWSSRQIRDGVNDGEMTPELLDACAKALDVHPDYLAGKYCRTLDYGIMRDEEIRQHWLETAMAPAAHPYKYFKQQGINTRAHFYNTLLLHGVERDAFDSLSRNEQEDIERALDWAETRTLRKFFEGAKEGDWASYAFDNVFQDERDIIEYMLEWLEEHGKIRVQG